MLSPERRTYSEGSPERRAPTVIELTRIDGTTFYLNPDHIELMEGTHETHITLTNGHKYVCSESPEVIAERIVEYRRAAASMLRRIA